MCMGYTRRKDKGYEVQMYDREGKATSVIGCETLEDVAKILISICNGNVKGNYPTVWKDGELIRN